VIDQITQKVESHSASRRGFFHCEPKSDSLENAITSTGC
jgi:hypothetical protein